MLSRLQILISLILSIIISEITCLEYACNTTLYDEWLETEYNGGLLRDETVWQYDSLDLELTNRVMLQMVTARCREQFLLISEDVAGLHGPVTDQQLFDIMCSSACLGLLSLFAFFFN